MAQTNTEIKHAYGSLAKVLAKIGTADGMACFGFDTEKKTGAVVVNGQLVSSKILDIAKAETVIEGVTDGKKQTVTITYIDADTKATATTTFEAVDLDTINALIEAVKTDTSSATDVINTFLEGTTLIAAGDGITVTPTQTAGAPTTYEVKANVDGTSVKIKDGKLAVDTYSLTEAETAETGYLKTYEFTVKHADGTTVDTVTKINIPKDLLLKKAAVEDLPAEQGEGKGLHFVVNTADESGTATDLWIPVKELAVSLYTGDDYITVTADATNGNTITLNYSVLLNKIKSDLTYVESVGAKTEGVLPEGTDKTYVKVEGVDTVTLNAGAWDTYAVVNSVAGAKENVEIKTVSEKAIVDIYETIIANEKTSAEAFATVNAYQVIRNAVAAAGTETNAVNNVTENEVTKNVFNEASKYVTAVTLSKGAVDGSGATTDTVVKVLNSDFGQYVLDQLALATGDTGVVLDALTGDVDLLKTDVSTLKEDVSTLKDNVSVLDASLAALNTDVNEAIDDIKTTLLWIDLDDEPK